MSLKQMDICQSHTAHVADTISNGISGMRAAARRKMMHETFPGTGDTMRQLPCVISTAGRIRTPPAIGTRALLRTALPGRCRSGVTQAGHLTEGSLAGSAESPAGTSLLTRVGIAFHA